MDLRDVSWRKSSFSSSNGGTCVEVGVAWRKSSYSTDNAGACVEVGIASEAAPTYLVRDSKDPEGPKLAFGTGQWGAFVTGIKGGEFRAVG